MTPPTSLPDTPPGAVVFDLDGVLLDTTENMRHAFAAVWAAAGRPGVPPFESFLTHMGAPLHVILEKFRLTADYAPVYAAASSARLDLVLPYPGITEVLRALRAAGVPVGVATGKSHQRAVEALRSGGLYELLDVVVGSDQVSLPKPDAEILHTALSLLPGAPHAGGTAVFVGDSVLDLRCGHAARVPTIAAGWGQSSRATLLAEGPGAFAATPRDLEALLALSPAGPGLREVPVG
ncbi:HAD family hydrolase [Streptomyces californicus]|uniref:HAD family hydrolase n=1 Tax=Streptomyces californicus TaxID=67351 RepID=UPI003683D2B6